jgi:hypothetical protein
MPARAAHLPLEDALQLVHLYAERGSPKYERAAMRWLTRYLTEARRGSSTSLPVKETPTNPDVS